MNFIEGETYNFKNKKTGVKIKGKFRSELGSVGARFIVKGYSRTGHLMLDSLLKVNCQWEYVEL